jgi:hypothetical protein
MLVFFTFIIVIAIIIELKNLNLIYLIFDLVKIEFQILKWKLWLDPRNPIVKYLIWRQSLKLAKELLRDLEK